MAMHTWFECKIRYEKTNGKRNEQKKVTEPYLVDALSFTEAEARIIEEMTPFITGEFTVSDIKRANYSELFPQRRGIVPTAGSSANSSLSPWTKKAVLRKRLPPRCWCRHADLRDAVKKLDEGMKGTMADYQIGSVAETAIMDVYPYSAGPNDKPEV